MISGLLLLGGSGIHVVWGIFRVFYLYNCEEENSFHFRFVIWSWYIGAIIGSCLAGYAIAKIRKGHLYVCVLIDNFINNHLFWIKIVFCFSAFPFYQKSNLIDDWRCNAISQRHTIDILHQ